MEAFDEYVAGRGSIPETGPLSVMLHVPELIKRGEHLRAYLRGGESSLPSNIRELGMLLAAREMDCQFIWNAHAAFGRQSGLSDDLVDSLRDRKELPALSPAESAVIEYGREFFRTHRVSQATFDNAMAQFGTRGLGGADHPDGLLRLPGLQHQRLRGRPARRDNRAAAAGVAAVSRVHSPLRQNNCRVAFPDPNPLPLRGRVRVGVKGKSRESSRKSKTGVQIALNPARLPRRRTPPAYRPGRPQKQPRCRCRNGFQDPAPVDHSRGPEQLPLNCVYRTTHVDGRLDSGEVPG